MTTDISKTITECESIKINQTNLFINELTKVVNAVLLKNKNEDFIGIKDKYMILKRETPEIVIQEAGSYLWSYRQEIADKAIDKLLSNKFEKDIDKAKLSNKTDSLQNIHNIIAEVKKTWIEFSSAEQNMLLTILNKMITMYATYLHSEIKIKTLKK